MRILSIIFTLLMFANTVFAAPFEADAKTKRIPAGTVLSLQLLSPIDTRTNSEGDYFNAMLLTEQVSGANVILPSGSVVRGCVRAITQPKRFSKGAVLYLDFDHVVTPSGRQLPLAMGLTGITHLTADGGIYGSLGYGEAVQENWEKTKEITSSAIDVGLSVSRVGSNAQFKAVKKTSSSLKMEISQFHELEAFNQFGSDIDIETKKILKHGAILEEILKQNQYLSLSTSEETIYLFAAKSGLLDDLEVEKVKSFLTSLYKYIKDFNKEIIIEIEEKHDLSQDKFDELKNIILNFKKELLLNNGN